MLWDWDAIPGQRVDIADRKEEVTSYEVECCSLIACTLRVVNDSESVVVKDLPQYTLFTIKVRGRNSQNAGPWKIIREVKTLDLDECNDGHSCECACFVHNTAGSYECRCKSGLTGDGYWCEAVPTGSSDDDFCKEELFRNITWMRTPKGKTIKRRCPYGFSVTPNLFSPRSPAETIDSDTAVSLANELSQITNPARDELVVSGDLHAAVGMLETLDQKTKNMSMSKEKANTFMKNVVQVANNLLDGKAMEAWQDSSAKSRSENAYKTPDLHGEYSPDDCFRFKRQKYIQCDNFPMSSDLSPAGTNGPGSKIEMPTSELSNRESNGTTNHIAFIYLRNVAQLLTTSSTENDTAVNSGSDESLQPSCVFWKISGVGGSWSTEGCNLNSANSTHTVCHCYHLTSFSILMQYTPESYDHKGTHELALSLITYIGISISLVALILTSNRNFAHINLVLSLILAELLFVVGIDTRRNMRYVIRHAPRMI
ncbi:hypothetical protein OS493_039499 [Desmophyllum pertusum]|uniref:GAIN-B domain-containing protein n=1 Tax=Desmophyllum pertusum TaxID=174260 RepID=A0A9W9ZVE3_9CNID|nr:hypothetical protein OS493_039499 [Desmophyllum pertusum]